MSCTQGVCPLKCLELQTFNPFSPLNVSMPQQNVACLFLVKLTLYQISQKITNQVLPINISISFVSDFSKLCSPLYIAKCWEKLYICVVYYWIVISLSNLACISFDCFSSFLCFILLNNVKKWNKVIIISVFNNNYLSFICVMYR